MQLQRVTHYNDCCLKASFNRIYLCLHLLNLLHWIILVNQILNFIVQFVLTDLHINFEFEFVECSIKCCQFLAEIVDQIQFVI